ncbi:MAG TPA: hypothetical protein VGZ22_08880 [Isosphaeraceae bacterium]|nr:hypothetical protein [Isosphaeraceae bacterium]
MWLDYDRNWGHASRGQRILTDLIEMLGHQCSPIATDGSRSIQTQIHSADVLLLVGGSALEDSELVRGSVREAIGAGKSLLVFGVDPSKHTAREFLKLNYGVTPLSVRCWAAPNVRYIDVAVPEDERASSSSWFSGMASLRIDQAWLLRSEPGSYSVLPLPEGLAFVNSTTDLFTEADPRGCLVAAWPVVDRPERPRVLVFGGWIVPNYSPDDDLRVNWTLLLRVLLLAAVNPPSAPPGLEARGYVKAITSCLQRSVSLRLGTIHSDIGSCWGLLPPRSQRRLLDRSGMPEKLFMKTSIAEALDNADIGDFKDIIRHNWSTFDQDWDPGGQRGRLESTRWIEPFNNIRRRVVGHEDRLDREPVTDEELEQLSSTLPVALATYIRVSGETHAEHTESQLIRWRSLEDWMQLETTGHSPTTAEGRAAAVAAGVSKAVAAGHVVKIASNVLANAYFETCKKHGRIYVGVTLEEDRAYLQVNVPQGQSHMRDELQEALSVEWHTALGPESPPYPVNYLLGSASCSAYPISPEDALTLAQRSADVLRLADRLPAPTEPVAAIDPRLQGSRDSALVITTSGKPLHFLRLLPGTAAASARIHLSSEQYKQLLQLPVPTDDPDGWEAGLWAILNDAQKETLEQWGETAFTVD